MINCRNHTQMLDTTIFLTAQELINNYNNSLNKQERENIERIRKETEIYLARFNDDDLDEEE